MTQRRISSVFFTLIPFSLTFSFASIPACSANDANWGILCEVDSFNNGTHISMPFADIEVNTTRTAATVYPSFTSEFPFDIPLVDGLPGSNNAIILRYLVTLIITFIIVLVLHHFDKKRDEKI